MWDGDTVMVPGMPLPWNKTFFCSSSGLEASVPSPRNQLCRLLRFPGQAKSPTSQPGKLRWKGLIGIVLVFLYFFILDSKMYCSEVTETSRGTVVKCRGPILDALPPTGGWGWAGKRRA